MTKHDSRTTKHQPRSGKSHDLADFIPHATGITMHPATAAKALLFHKRTVADPQIGVVSQLLTVPAEKIFFSMSGPAVNINHQINELFFLIPLLLQQSSLFRSLHCASSFRTKMYSLSEESCKEKR